MKYHRITVTGSHIFLAAVRDILCMFNMCVQGPQESSFAAMLLSQVRVSMRLNVCSSGYSRSMDFAKSFSHEQVFFVIENDGEVLIDPMD